MLVREPAAQQVTTFNEKSVYVKFYIMCWLIKILDFWMEFGPLLVKDV